MTREDVQSVIDDIYQIPQISEVIVYARFQVVRLVKDCNGQFPAFTLSDTMLEIETPGGYQYLSLSGVDLIVANY